MQKGLLFPSTRVPTVAASHLLVLQGLAQLHAAKAKLSTHTCTHLLVLQRLPRLHDAHDGGFNGVLAVLVHIVLHLAPVIHQRQRDLRQAV